MNKLVLEKKIDSILRCIERIQTRLPDSKDTFLLDLDAQDVTTLNLTRIIQLSVDIAMHIIANTNSASPQTMSESFTVLQTLGIIDQQTASKLKKSVGYRNIAVHNYGELDLSLTYDIAKKHIGDFKSFIKQIINHLVIDK